MALPDQLGIEEYFRENLHDSDGMRAHPWLVVLDGPFSLLCLFGPIYAAAWFYRICRYWAYCGSPGREAQTRVKTRATRWLVWMGVVCMLMPLVKMIVTLKRMMQSPNGQLPSGALNGSLAWTEGLLMVGFLLIFVGLVRRRPVLKQNEETTSENARGSKPSLRD